MPRLGKSLARPITGEKMSISFMLAFKEKEKKRRAYCGCRVAVMGFESILATAEIHWIIWPFLW